MRSQSRHLPPTAHFPHESRPRKEKAPAKMLGLYRGGGLRGSSLVRAHISIVAIDQVTTDANSDTASHYRNRKPSAGTRTRCTGAQSDVGGDRRHSGECRSTGLSGYHIKTFIRLQRYVAATIKCNHYACLRSCHNSHIVANSLFVRGRTHASFIAHQHVADQVAQLCNCVAIRVRWIIARSGGWLRHSSRHRSHQQRCSY